MRRAGKLGRPFLFTAIVAYSIWASPRFCRAQGNSSASVNPCDKSGTCGGFGVCNSQGSPICSCLRGFDPRNNEQWETGNWSSGCVRRVDLSCELGNNINGSNNSRREDDGFFKLQITILSEYSELWYGTENQCQTRCLTNCSCLAYLFVDNTGCRFWSGNLIDLQKSPTASASNLYIRVSNSELG